MGHRRPKIQFWSFNGGKMSCRFSLHSVSYSEGLCDRNRMGGVTHSCRAWRQKLWGYQTCTISLVANDLTKPTECWFEVPEGFENTTLHSSSDFKLIGRHHCTDRGSNHWRSALQSNGSSLVKAVLLSSGNIIIIITTSIIIIIIAECLLLLALSRTSWMWIYSFKQGTDLE